MRVLKRMNCIWKYSHKPLLGRKIILHKNNRNISYLQYHPLCHEEYDTRVVKWEELERKQF